MFKLAHFCCSLFRRSCDDFQQILFHFGWYFGGEIIFHFSANVNASYGIATESLWSGTSCNSWRMRILTWTMYVGVIHEALEHEYLHCFGSAYSLAIHVVVGCFFEAIVFSIFWMVHVTIPFPSSIFLDPFADLYSKSSLWRRPTCALCAFMCVVYICAHVYLCISVYMYLYVHLWSIIHALGTFHVNQIQVTNQIASHSLQIIWQSYQLGGH